MATCKSCGAEIWWKKYVLSRQAAPIDAEVVPEGNILVSGDTYRIIPEADRAKYAGQLHKNHFATCANSAQHHKAKS